MAIHPFLAMTAAEMQEKSQFPENIAWMACHFSPYGTGLSNMPTALPPNSLLILNDRTPIHRHDPERIAQQLTQCIEDLNCHSVLLDFQRPGCKETTSLIKYLSSTLPCPLAVAETYADDKNSYAVFLPPVPPSTPLETYISPWVGRELWLELALDGEIITLTEQGAEATPLPFPDLNAEGFAEKKLHCHYRAEVREDRAEFTLWRTWEDLLELTKEAETLGVMTAVGLYQEIHPYVTET